MLFDIIFCGNNRYYVINDRPARTDFSINPKECTEGIVVFWIEEQWALRLVVSTHYFSFFWDSFEEVDRVDLLDFFAWTSFAIQIDKQVANKYRIEVVFDRINYFLCLMGVLGQLGPHGMQLQKNAELLLYYLLKFYLAFFILGFISLSIFFYFSPILILYFLI